jgi:hypothetical protein
MYDMPVRVYTRGVTRESITKKVREGYLAMGDSRGPEEGPIFWAGVAYSHKI